MDNNYEIDNNMFEIITNPNSYLEAGMFMSLGKKILLIKNEKKGDSIGYD